MPNGRNSPLSRPDRSRRTGPVLPAPFRSPPAIRRPAFSTGRCWRSIRACTRHRSDERDVDAAGRIAVTGSHDKTVRLWSVADGKLLRTIRMPTGPGDVGKVYAVAISPDGATIAAGGWTRWTRGGSARADLPVRCRHRRDDRPASTGCRTSSSTSPSRPTAGGWRRCSAAAACGSTAAAPTAAGRRGARRGLRRRQLRRRLRPRRTGWRQRAMTAGCGSTTPPAT